MFVLGGCAMCVIWIWFLLFAGYKMDVLFVMNELCMDPFFRFFREIYLDGSVLKSFRN